MRTYMLAICVTIWTAASVKSVPIVPVGNLVISPSLHGTEIFGMSFLIGEWSADTNQMIAANPAVSYDGNANFEISGPLTVAGNTLTIPFTNDYANIPACHFNFRDYTGSIRVAPAISGVELRLYDSAGGSVAWNQPSLNFKFQLSCFGVYSPPPPSG
eukprot:m.306618 g.306618  ORF g.306618 m.306618 type:complete len:158 (+) comp41408_c0_seq1:113-586(+)